MRVVGVSSSGIQLERGLKTRVLEDGRSLAAQIHRFSLHVLVVEVHQDHVRSKLGLVLAIDPARRAEVVELHEGEQRLVELLALVVSGKALVVNLRVCESMQRMDVEASNQLVAVDG